MNLDIHRLLPTSHIQAIQHKLSILRPEVTDGCYLVSDAIKEIPLLSTASYNCTMVRLYGSDHTDDQMLQELNEDVLVLIRRREALILSTLYRKEFLVVYGNDYDFDFDDNGMVMQMSIQKMGDQTLEQVYDSLVRSLKTKENNENG